MSQRNTVIRTLHDVGLAAWFGGSLMGVIGVNGGSATAHDPSERLRLSSNGWALWTPWQIGAIAVHTVGGVGLMIANRGRVARQSGAKANTVLKLALTGVAMGASAYAGVLGAKVKQHEDEGAPGATEPSASNSSELASAQQQLKALQWTIPAVTAVLIGMGAQQGEQQRTPIGLIDKITNL